MFFRTLISVTFLSLFVLPVMAEVAVSDALKSQYRRPVHVPFPPDNPYSADKAALGKMLFFDPRLSRGFNFTCATCHNPSLGWENGVPRSVGDLHEPLARHSPTILNLAWTNTFFWDGRAESLEAQAQGPIEAEGEMNLPMEDVIARLKLVPDYITRFDRVFGTDGLTVTNILKSIATYERTLVSGPAPFDAWIEGDNNAISESAKRGFLLFNQEAACAKCHTGWNFTDNQFHDIGLANESDIGREGVTHNPQDRFAFKTPGLRNINQRAPFMHHGYFPTLESVIAHYETGGLQRPTLSDKMVAFPLTSQQRQDLVAFLNTLTGEDQEITLPLLPY